MAEVTQTVFASMAGVNRSAICIGIKNKSLVQNSAGKLDTDNPVNRRYLDKHQAKLRSQNEFETFGNQIEVGAVKKAAAGPKNLETDRNGVAETLAIDVGVEVGVYGSALRPSGQAQPEVESSGIVASDGDRYVALPGVEGALLQSDALSAQCDLCRGAYVEVYVDVAHVVAVGDARQCALVLDLSDDATGDILRAGHRAGVPARVHGHHVAKAHQATHHCGGEKTEPGIIRAPGKGDQYIEQEHRDGCTRRKAVDAVGDIHGVHGANYHKNCKKVIKDRRHIYRSAGERQVQRRMQEAQMSHQQQKDKCRNQLQEELRPGRQSEILSFPDLLPVVQKPDGTKDQCKHQHEDMLIVPFQHPREPQRQADKNLRKNEHHTSHGGGSALAGMLFELGLDLLSGFFLFQPGDIPFSESSYK